MLKKSLWRRTLSISSMTGFARESGEYNFEKTAFSWFWEIKSVNNKSIDVKLKMPGWLDSQLSLFCKNEAARNFARGSFGVYLDIRASNETPEVKINDELLQKLAAKAIELYDTFDGKLQKPSTTELLGLKGVVEVEDAALDEEETAALVGKLSESFSKACLKLKSDREAEGVKIRKALLDILDNIATIVARVEDIAKAQPERLKAKLQEQIAALLEPSNQISEERLAQEVALYVARADIQEEIDRLKAHIKTARDLLSSNEAVGRRLDFLCQELNREANTTCSKSGEIELTNLGMELKTLIEQFREQVQNIE